LGQGTFAPREEPEGASHQIAGVLALLHSPELNPAERIFEEVRRLVEGQVYDSIADKQAEVESYLRQLGADPERVKRLCGWEWVREALDRLPPSREAAAR
jgi:hypothetical protein